LRAQGFTVVMTRTKDAGISLEHRVHKIAKSKPADLFVSIHANSSANSAASGIETFCLTPSLFRTVSCSLSPQCGFAMDKLLACTDKKSLLFAKLLQRHVVHSARRAFPKVVDRKVKHAVARMLLGINIPGILLEVGFLTNKKEAELLCTANYQSVLAQGICKSVVDYFHRERAIPL